MAIEKNGKWSEVRISQNGLIVRSRMAALYHGMDQLFDIAHLYIMIQKLS